MESLPKQGAKKFKCPHCGVLSQQEWLNDELISSVTNSIANSFYYDYRSRVASYEQEAVAKFLNNLVGSSGFEGISKTNEKGRLII